MQHTHTKGWRAQRPLKPCCKRVQDHSVIFRQYKAKPTCVSPPGSVLLPEQGEQQPTGAVGSWVGTIPRGDQQQVSPLFCREKLFIPFLAMHAMTQFQL